MKADINAIEIAIEGRLEMLQVIFGDPKKPSPTNPTPVDAAGVPIKFSAGIFDTLFPGQTPDKIKVKVN